MRARKYILPYRKHRGGHYRGCPCCVNKPGNYSRAFGRYSHLKKSPDSPVDKRARAAAARGVTFDYRPHVPAPLYEDAAGGKDDRSAIVDYEELSNRLENLRAPPARSPPPGLFFFS